MANLVGLDAIPWDELTHAYGSAEDVPGLLLALQSPVPTDAGEDAPLWQLFGNIWHQGTVYEATAYAVPFLIELAADPGTPDRTGILQLLAKIADGKSYRAVHGDILKDADFEQERARELTRVANAHCAVADGIQSLLKIAEEGGELRLAAANVGARLPEHSGTLQPLLHAWLRAESGALRRAGLLLLLGLLRDESPLTLSVLLTALAAEYEVERRAAVISIARLRPHPLPAAAREAIVAALTVDDLEESFESLPWDAAGDVNRDALAASLDGPACEAAAERLIGRIESGGAEHDSVHTLLNLLFPRIASGRSKPLGPDDLSALQMRAARALAMASKGDRRIFIGSFSQWGLPETRRGWDDLIAGRAPVPIDSTLPILSDPSDPRLPLRPDQLKPGQRVLHRTFGIGTVCEAAPSGSYTEFRVKFDDEELMTLALPSDGSPLRG